MKPCLIGRLVLLGALGLGGCATNSELTQKEKDRMAREMERESRKQTQAQQKMLGGNTRTNSGSLGGQRTGGR